MDKKTRNGKQKSPTLLPRKPFRRYVTYDNVWEKAKRIRLTIQYKRNLEKYTISEMIDDLILEKFEELFSKPNKIKNYGKK